MNEKTPGGPSPSASNGGGYGYGMPYGPYGGYGGYGYGNPAGGPAGGGAVGRNVRDYLLILRERIWVFFVVFFIVLVGALLYHFQSPKVYEAQASLRMLRTDPNPIGEMKGAEIEEKSIRSAEDFNTEMRVFMSPDVIERVAQRLDREQRETLMAPYRDQLRLNEPTPQIILSENVSIFPERNAWIIHVAFEHVDPEFSATIANLFVAEFINLNVERESSTSHAALDDLNLRVEQQRQKVEDIRNQLADYRERRNLSDIDEEDSSTRQELSMLSTLVEERRTEFQEREQRWESVQDFRARDEPLTKLHFVGQDMRVTNLQQELSAARVNKASLAERYRAKHPQMIAVNNEIAELEAELAQAIDQIARQTEVDYITAKRALEDAEARKAAKDRELIELDKLRVEYNSLQSELEVAQTFMQNLSLRRSSILADIAMIRPKVQRISQATPPIEPKWPKLTLTLPIGIFGGIGAGLGLVFFLAFFDDRVKSAHDVESVVGLPVIGVIPRMKGINSPEKARAVASNMNRRVTEAFRGIHSALRINELSKNAKTILSTSTVPSEGKSFVTTNLALTYSIHGERVLVIDGDLRMPSVGKSLDLDESRGLNQVLEGEIPVEEAIYKDVYPSLDVLLAGGKARNPTQALTSKRFDELLLQLQQQYDRIIIDSPPIAAVSDALTVLQHVDGVVYLIKFNAVKRKTVKASVRRLNEANVPVFGAVLNQISIAVASYYYNNYYDKSYQNYYLAPDDGEEDEALASPANGRGNRRGASSSSDTRDTTPS